MRYARAVLYTRQKIKKRYTEIYRQLKNEKHDRCGNPTPEQKQIHECRGSAE